MAENSGKFTKPNLPDDRAEFEAERQRNCLALGADAALFEQARDCIMSADRHRYTYLWSWMGVPIIQVPSDIVATQEIIWATKPDVIIETGVARGGSVIFYASMLTLIGKGKVVGVDIDVRAHNRDTIEKHPMANRIALIEGSSIDAETIARVKAEIPPGAAVMLVLGLRSLQAACLGGIARPFSVCHARSVPYRRRHAARPPEAGADAEGAFAVLAARRRTAGGSPGISQGEPTISPDEEINGKMILSSSPGGLSCVASSRDGAAGIGRPPATALGRGRRETGDALAPIAADRGWRR